MRRGFGHYLRTLRENKGLGLKRVAPELGISYTFLSKLENGKVQPSDEVLERLANYYSIDDEQLTAQTGRLPADVKRILEEHPEEAVALLRSRFGR